MDCDAFAIAMLWLEYCSFGGTSSSRNGLATGCKNVISARNVVLITSHCRIAHCGGKADNTKDDDESDQTV
jgi:hypothetical protein